MTVMNNVEALDYSLQGYGTPYDYTELKRAQLEKTLNILGYISFVSSFTGAVRFIYGLVEMIEGIVKAIFVSIADCFRKGPYGHRTLRHISYTLHGLENMFRGLFEAMPIFFNNCALLIYDISVDRHEYPAEAEARLRKQALYNRVINFPIPSP